MEPFSNNIKDVALVFEGGGMRNSYSSGVVDVLLENGIFFDSVYAVSAGASNAINYLSRDLERSRLTFTEYSDDMPFRRGEKLLLKSGLFGAGRITPSDPSACEIPFDFEAFQANPAQLTLIGLNRDTGATTYWTREDFTTEERLRERVKATLSYPILMPPTRLIGEGGGVFYDGGPAEGGGIMVPRARRDGFRRYFVVCTQRKGYRKKLGRKWGSSVFFWRRPHMRAALNSWAQRYNEQLDALARLEQDGQAYVFYAEDQSVINRELSREKLRQNYERGYRQASRELGGWERFLGL